MIDSTFKFKTQLCRHFERGFCVRGEKCCFAHGNFEQKNTTIFKSFNFFEDPNEKINFQNVQFSKSLQTENNPEAIFKFENLPYQQKNKKMPEIKNLSKNKLDTFAIAQKIKSKQLYNENKYFKKNTLSSNSTENSIEKLENKLKKNLNLNLNTQKKNKFYASDSDTDNISKIKPKEEYPKLNTACCYDSNNNISEDL